MGAFSALQAASLAQLPVTVNMFVFGNFRALGNAFQNQERNAELVRGDGWNNFSWL